MNLSIVLLTYAPDVDHPRAEYARKTLRWVLANLHYSGPVYLHIADDGSGPGHVEALREIAEADAWGYHLTTSNSEGRGYGASYNLATQVTHPRDGLILPLEDDWQLCRELDLDPLAEALADPRINCIRLGYIGFTQPLYGEVISTAGQQFLLFTGDSPEPHVFTGHPRLETVAFERAVGEWPEGFTAGETEFRVAHRPEARQGIAWPLDLGLRASQSSASLFAHVGSIRAPFGPERINA